LDSDLPALRTNLLSRPYPVLLMGFQSGYMAIVI
jgi:hypothetical protein